MTETTLPDANDLSATKAILAGVLTPGRWAIVPMIPNDEPDETGFYGEEGPLQFIRNWADVQNRDAEMDLTEETPENGFRIDSDTAYCGFNNDTPFGPLTESASYIALPVENDEKCIDTEFEDEDFQWLILDITQDTEVRVTGSVISIGDASFDFGGELIAGLD
ncbi:MAG: hypothetical protein CMN74_02190 [Sphingorhabdus sp.]|nr:hypothetical protein [Sphingorhabdus sp.]|tara:strand:+ start:4827 stop:5318 length:492 start_codon:yes stop_codon:yes gene_type:complete